jgi:5-methylcytosine-specific restriction endonuclease McrBC regulatory subunit McrC
MSTNIMNTDSLAWSMALDRLWEYHVEAHVREEVRLTGGVVRVGRLGETVTPLHWTDPSHRSLGHLVPDIAVIRGRAVWVVDAKYKAHFAEIDERGWRQMANDIRESHRADLHQALAYASLFDADEITTTLAYPLRQSTWAALRERGIERSTAEVYHGARHITLELRGLPFHAMSQRSC